MITRGTDIKAALRSRQRGFLLNPFRFGGTPPGDTDPYFSNVSLLLHMDGADGSTAFTDSSGAPKTVTRSGQAVISTSQSKFGGSSGYFDGSGDYLTAPASSAFVFSGDLTIEAFVRSSSSAANCALFGVGFSTGGFKLLCRNSSVNRLDFVYFNGSGYPSIGAIDANINDSAWHHVAISRSGTTLRIFLDGVQVASGTVSVTLGDASKEFWVGGHAGDNNYLLGHLEEFRVTNSVARYTANFTPPTAPFPNS